MNMLTTSIKLIRGQIRSIATILCIATLFSLAFTLHAHAQQQEISIPADRIEVLQTFPISKSGKLFPREERMRMGDSTQLFRTAEGFDPVAVYANSSPSSFIGYIIFNGSQVNGITRLIADNLSLVGTPPYKIGYVFSSCAMVTPDRSRFARRFAITLITAEVRVHISQVSISYR